jgi:AhpD family alkylhydroperoxidase
MAYLPSLPGDAVLLDVFRAYPDTARPLLAYHQALLRGPSPLSVAERELIAAYVSGLNACGYCHGVHTATAQAFGIGEGTLGALLANVSTAPVAEPMKPILQYVGKLTLTPAKITPEDAEGSAGRGLAGAGAARRGRGVRTVQHDEPAGGRPGYHRGRRLFRMAAGRLAGAGYAGLKDLL